MAPKTYESADYYKDIVVSQARIGNEFADCKFSWPFPAGLLVIKNDSLQTNIEYSFDGDHTAGKLMHGTDEHVGGESFTYTKTERMEIYLRRAHKVSGLPENAGEANIPYRLWANKEPGDS